MWWVSTSWWIALFSNISFESIVVSALTIMHFQQSNTSGLEIIRIGVGRDTRSRWAGWEGWAEWANVVKVSTPWWIASFSNISFASIVVNALHTDQQFKTSGLDSIGYCSAFNLENCWAFWTHIVRVFFTMIYQFPRSLKNYFSLVDRMFWAGWAIMLDSLKKVVSLLKC